MEGWVDLEVVGLGRFCLPIKFQNAVTKACTKSHNISYVMPTDPTGGAYDAPPNPLVGCAPPKTIFWIRPWHRWAYISIMHVPPLQEGRTRQRWHVQLPSHFQPDHCFEGDRTSLPQPASTSASWLEELFMPTVSLPPRTFHRDCSTACVEWCVRCGRPEESHCSSRIRHVCGFWHHWSRCAARASRSSVRCQWRSIFLAAFILD